MSATGHKITVNAPKSEVYKAITTQQGLKGWYSPSAEGKTDMGGEVTLSFTEKEGPFRWKVVESTPEDLVRWECISGPGKAQGTFATYRLSEKNGGTVVDFRHEGVSDFDEKLETCNTLWGALMHHLKKYVESGTSEPAFR